MLGSNGKGQDPVLIVKRHWVWLLVQISGPSTSQLEETKNYDGDILLLEEDHVPSPDIFVTLDFLLSVKNDSPDGICANCWAVAMGAVSPCSLSSLHKPWSLSCVHRQFVNTGLVFNRSIFHAIIASDFLAFRDGWDWSLFHVLQTRQMLSCQPDCHPAVLSPHVSRIRNIGKDGVTMRSNDPDLLKLLNYSHIPDDIWEQGFDPASLEVTYDADGKSAENEPLSQALYMGNRMGFLNQRDWS